MAKITKEELQKLFAEFLATLDDTDYDEWYSSSKGYADAILEDFMDWLDHREENKNA